ncbi:PD-(D/E)XK nuclease superfamily protein [Bremerella volcania]|uniref:PD-(D/E)XK nuclease superfamily protein n=1 Tax=Bremerella volcania TaxID=2527984 RepID=A0A518C5Z5_9BACT|nr:PD-(D/E)XK nuclease family protein [Bremerella volcania]QDU74650.1 PD-(D/E)XK nuclease superfamily protein [Bremerella volcania]
MIATLTRASPARDNNSGLLDYVSPTRLNTWVSCPLKFKLRYVDGIKEPTSPSLFLGKRVHAGLEFFYRQIQAGENVTSADVSQHISDSWDEAVTAEDMQFASFDDEAALKCQTIGLVGAYLDRHDSKEGFPIAVESPLECPLIEPHTGADLGTALFGFVDLILETPTGMTIVDFKTAARTSAPLEISHEVQLSCYAYAFRHVFGATEQELQIRSLIKTKTPKVETHRYPARGDAHFRRLFAVIRAYLDDLQSNRFVYRPGWTCSMCDYRETDCRQWQG